MTAENQGDVGPPPVRYTERVRLRKAARWTTWGLLTAVIFWQGAMISESVSKVRDANERLFRIVHGSPTATVMCDDHGKVIEYNRAAEELLGWTRTEILDKNVEMLIAEPYRNKHKATFKKSIDALREVDEDWRITKTGLHGVAVDKDGKDIPIEFSTRGIRYGSKIEFLAFIQPDVPPPVVPKIEAGPLSLPKKAVP